MAAGDLPQLPSHTALGSNSRGWEETREWVQDVVRQPEPPWGSAAPTGTGGIRVGTAQGRTHLGDEDSQLRGFSSPDVEAQLWGKPAGKCSHQDPSLGPVLFPFPRTFLPVQGPSNSQDSPPCPASKAWVLQCSARQQHQVLSSPNTCQREHLRGPAPILQQLHIPGYYIGNNSSSFPPPWHLSPCQPHACHSSSLCQDAAGREYRDPSAFFVGKRSGNATPRPGAPGRRLPAHLRSGRLLEDDGAGQELRELVVVVGVINALRGTRGGSVGAGPGSPARRGPAAATAPPGPFPRSPRPGLTSCGGTQAGGLS